MGGIGSGGYREGGGRPPGARNKKALALIEQAERDDLQTPISFLLDVMRDPRQALHDRMMAANICMPYMHAKLVPQPVAVINPARLTDEQLLRSLADLERQIGEMEPEAEIAPLANPAPGAVARPETWQPPPAPRPMLRRPGSDPPAPAEGRRLQYDPIAKKLVQAVQ